MKRLPLDLAVVLALACVGAVVALASPPSWLEAIALLPLALALPGYALAAALFPPETLSAGERLVHAYVLTISVTAIGGLVLQIFVGLDRAAWTCLLLGATIVSVAVALRRRARLGMPPSPPSTPRFRAADLLFPAALAIGALAVAVAVQGVHDQQARQVFTSLWAVPADSRFEAAPAIRVGVWDHGEGGAYTLELSQGNRVLRRLPVRVGPMHHWERTLRTPASLVGEETLKLTLLHGATPYRNVELDLGSEP